MPHGWKQKAHRDLRAGESAGFEPKGADGMTAARSARAVREAAGVPCAPQLDAGALAGTEPKSAAVTRCDARGSLRDSPRCAASVCFHESVEAACVRRVEPIRCACRTSSTRSRATRSPMRLAGNQGPRAARSLSHLPLFSPLGAKILDFPPLGKERSDQVRKNFEHRWERELPGRAFRCAA